LRCEALAGLATCPGAFSFVEGLLTVAAAVVGLELLLCFLAPLPRIPVELDSVEPPTVRTELSTEQQSHVTRGSEQHHVNTWTGLAT